jgi:hypothetical protein
MWIGERVPTSDPFFPMVVYNEKDETLPEFGCPLHKPHFFGIYSISFTVSFSKRRFLSRHTDCTMKLSATTLSFLLGTSSWVDASNKRSSTSLEYNDQETIVDRILQGKKGDMSGGKKGGVSDGDCVDGTTAITSCGDTISMPGRYVLTSDLRCADGESGIEITASDVHLDCQDFDFIGNLETTDLVNGIVVNGASHVTVANCGAEIFFDGLQAVGLWTDLTVRSSSFNNNVASGMNLIGDVDSPSEFTVVDSTFNGNGNIEFGVGIRSLDARGTVYFSTMNNNLGNGLATSGTGALTLVDVEAVGNGKNGLLADGGATLNVINSLACSNGSTDIFNPTTAQANTCSSSSFIGMEVLPVCQCLCDVVP